jgi:hypothetical protein
MVLAGEIYFVAGVEIGVCSDARPCLVLQVFKSTALICILSAQFDLAEGHEITLLKSDANFPESGLKKNSFIPDAPERDVSIDVLEKSIRLGKADGNFKRQVEQWFGVMM